MVSHAAKRVSGHVSPGQLRQVGHALDTRSRAVTCHVMQQVTRYNTHTAVTRDGAWPDLAGRHRPGGGQQRGGGRVYAAHAAVAAATWRARAPLSARHHDGGHEVRPPAVRGEGRARGQGAALLA